MESMVLIRPSPAREVVLRLKRHGRMSIKDLEADLGVTRNAVRQQLSALEQMGLVERTFERGGVGRPKGLYALTVEGHRLFAREYEPLLRHVLEELTEAGDPAALRALMSRVSRKLAEGFEPVPDGSTLAERVAFLVEQLSRRGHLTEAEAIPEGYALRMYNCPYHELVADHPVICEVERSMLRELLGSGVNRHKCILDERYTYCAYSVSGADRKSEANVQP